MARWSAGASALTGSIVVLFASSHFLFPFTQIQAQGVNSDLWKSVDACQKVVKKHQVLADNVLASTMRQLSETNATLEAYVIRWGARVIAGAESGAMQDAVAKQVQNCHSNFTRDVAKLADTMQAKLENSVRRQILWYDDKIFSLFSDVMSEQQQAGVVQMVKGNLDPTIKTFENEAVSSLKNSIKDVKPYYQAMSACIRTTESTLNNVMAFHTAT